MKTNSLLTFLISRMVKVIFLIGVIYTSLRALSAYSKEGKSGLVKFIENEREESNKTFTNKSVKKLINILYDETLDALCEES